MSLAIRPKPDSFTSAMALTVLLVGLLATGIDLLEDHSAAIKQAGSSHSESADRLPLYHLVRHQVTKTPSGCTVCFFNKLLGQSLFPARNLVAAANISIQPIDAFRISVPHPEFDAEVNRGPPGA